MLTSPATLWVITSKERLPPLYFHFLRVEMKSKGALLVYIPHLVDKVAHFLNENEM